MLTSVLLNPWNIEVMEETTFYKVAKDGPV